MDIEQARFILSSFRPDGQDANDKDFAEALALAAENRELGEWLSRERAQDAAFSSALVAAEIPETLREDILMSLSGEFAQSEDKELDAIFMGAFSDIEVPEDLRDQILVSMEQESVIERPTFGFSKLLPIAAALVLAATAVFLFGPLGGGTSETVALDAREAQLQTGRKLMNNNIILVANNTEDSVTWLKSQELPTVEIPKALKSMKCAGATCVTLEGGVKASLMRFVSNEGKEVNMLVMNSDELSDFKNIPVSKEDSGKDAYFCSHCDYMIAKIRSGKAVVILLSQLDKERTTKIF